MRRERLSDRLSPRITPSYSVSEDEKIQHPDEPNISVKARESVTGAQCLLAGAGHTPVACSVMMSSVVWLDLWSGERL